MAIHTYFKFNLGPVAIEWSEGDMLKLGLI